MATETIGVRILLVFVLACSSCSSATRSCASTTTGNITPVKKMMIDTDAGGDDAVAILMALQAEKLDNGPTVVGITCVNGNAYVDQVAVNVLKTLKVADRLDIPVYKGAAHPLVLADTKDYYFGEDGFGDFNYPDPPSTDLIKSTHAVIAMINLVRKYPGEMTILALGPLTNIALAIRMYPKFLDKVQQIICMGGSVEGRGNYQPGIEFNFAVDPDANYVVFNSSESKPTILVPLETCQRTGIPIDVRLSLSEANNDYIWLIDNAAAAALNSTDGYWYSADAVAAAVAITSGSIVRKSNRYYSDAIYDGSLTRGMIVVDYTNITGNAPNTVLIQNLDVNLYQDLFFRYFTNGRRFKRRNVPSRANRRS